MQIGFNNDVEFEGVRYHIQTEDHGLDDGRITSQVFRAGQIVESMTVSYTNAIKRFSEPAARDEEIRKRMKALHALCYRNVRSRKYVEETAEPPAERSDPTEVVAVPSPEAEAPVVHEVDELAKTPLELPASVRDTAEDTVAPGPSEQLTPDDDEEEEHAPTAEMDSPHLEMPPELRDEPDLARFVEEVDSSLVVEEIDIAQLSSSDLIPVQDPDELVEPEAPEEPAPPERPARSKPQHVLVSESGIVYDHTIRAFRGVDLPADDQLLFLMNRLIDARAAGGA